MDRGKGLHLGSDRRKRNDKGKNLGDDALLDDRSCFPTLLPKHKIFLSHSGKQKWFVEKLCEDLEARHRFPFFDKRPSSLPKGERFPKLIHEAAERCEMAVVVVSEEFLTSKWPMMELSMFVRALLGSNPGLKILPLFFGMSVSDLRSRSKQGAWLRVWNKWARDDPRIKPVEFEEALKVMRSFNGIMFNGDMHNVWNYERDVVESICSEVGADVKWEDSHVQGRSSICEATRENMMVVEPDRNGIYVFGYYGMGGIGKTTMCKTLCNELFEFSSKVCHVELGGIQSVEQLLKKVLKKLTNTSEEVLQKLNEDECRSILKNRSIWRRQTFLAIDNVWDDNKSLEQAEMFLQDPTFYEGSVVMVTSRCRRTLMRVGIEELHCFEMPELGEVDARKLFLHHAARGKQFANEEDNVAIEECIARCWFQKSETQGYHYLPLALKVLGVHLRRCGPSPVEWLEVLPEVRDFNRFEGDNPVFSIIRLNYDRLSAQLQALFMDVAVFHPYVFMGTYGMTGYFDWFSLVHRQKLQVTQSQLQHLKDSGLLEDVDLESEKVSVHDLYKEFAKIEARGKLDSSADFNTRKWVYHVGSFPSDLERTPSGGCWENLTRVNLIVQYDVDDCGEVLNLQGIQWRYFSNLIVLELSIQCEARGVLKLEGLRCLRSLMLSGGGRSVGLDGLKDLNNLTFFTCRSSLIGLDRYESNPKLPLPTSLKILNLSGRCNICLSSDMFGHCTNLLELSLSHFEASGSIDLRQCKSLRSVYLDRIDGLETLLVHSTGFQSCLRSLFIEQCWHLSGVLGLGDLDRLDFLNLSSNGSLKEIPDLQKLTSLQCLTIDSGWSDFSKIHGLGSLRQLREIHCFNLKIRELPNLNALKHLHHLNLPKCKNLRNLEGVEGLTALRNVNLRGCSSLLRLPDLSNSTKLGSLYLSGSGIELHEKDIDMLATLPELYLVTIADSPRGERIALDSVRRKLVFTKKLDENSSSTVVEEQDLVEFPIQLRYLTKRLSAPNVTVDD